MFRTATRRLGAGIAAVTLALTAAPAAYADPDPVQTELKVEGSFDKPSYASGTTAILRVTISNIGPVAAEKVTLWQESGSFWPGSWGELEYGKGALIQPGETRTFEFRGQVWGDSVTSRSHVGGANVVPVHEPRFDLWSEVHAATGGWGGVVYGDRNENNQIDPGELLGGTKIKLSGIPSGSYETTATAADDGSFSFAQVPTGQYNVYYTFPSAGWFTPSPHAAFEINEGPPVHTIVRAQRPLTDRLKASVELKKKTYQPGDTVPIKITLTNKGATPITDLHAGCNRVGNENQLGPNPGWGPLWYENPGVTLAAGETKTLHVTDVVPAAAKDWGEVVASCDFGPGSPGADPTGHPWGGDSARVPGVRGGADFTVANSDSQPVPGVTVLLIDPYTNFVVERKTSDTNGQFQVRDRQVGYYTLYVLGGWKNAQPDVRPFLRADNPSQEIKVAPR